MTEAQREIVRLAEYLTDEQAEATLAFARYCFLPGKDKSKIPDVVTLSVKAGMNENTIKGFVMDALDMSEAEFNVIMNSNLEKQRTIMDEDMCDCEERKCDN